MSAKVLLIVLLPFTTACIANGGTQTSQPLGTRPGDAEPVVSLELPPEPQRIARAQEQLGDVHGACQTYEMLRVDPQASDSMRVSTTERLTALECP